MQQDLSLCLSLFRSVTSNQPITVSMEQIVSGIRLGRWQQPVEAIRLALARGDKQAVADGKRALPFAAFSGIFEGGHRATQLLQYNGLVVLDYDKIPDYNRLTEMRRRCEAHPSVVSAFITPSGQGLKVVVLTNGQAEKHSEMYACVAHTFDRLLGCHSDPACKDISRGHFVSYDPEATYHPDARPFCLEERSPENSGAEEQDLSPIHCLPSQTTPDACQPNWSTGEVEKFVGLWLELYPAVEGQRNNTLFRLACEAHKRGIPQQALQQAALSLMGVPGFDSREICSVVKSAYSRRETGEFSLTAKTPPVTAIPPLGGKGEDPEPEEGLLPEQIMRGEVLREHTPCFPEVVFEGLPDLLKEGLKFASDERERDMLLLSLITAASGVLPQVTGYYDRRRYWPNLYTFIVAGAASNKSVLDYGLMLCREYIEENMKRNKELEETYKTEREAYEQALRSSRQGQGSQQTISPPQEPDYFYPHIPADISKARLLQHLRQNGDRGGLLFDTEADTLTCAGNQEYGNFFDYLRKFFQHEATSSSFKANGQPIYLSRPRLTVLLAGTPAQLSRMIPTSENGLYSRFLFYTYRSRAQWKQIVAGDEEEDSVERHFGRLSRQLCQVIERLQQSPTRVKLTPEQWEKFNKTFQGLLTESAMHEREDFQSCIKRHGLITLRLCMIFTALNKVEQGYPAETVFCLSKHFHAALAIATTCLEHSRLLITSIRAGDKDLQELENPDKLSLILARLPKRFTMQQYRAEATHLGISIRTAERLLFKAIGLRVKKISRGVYEITA